MQKAQERIFFPIVFPKKDPCRLEKALFKVIEIHTKGTGIIGVSSHARKYYNQKPFDIKKKTLYFNEGDSYLLEIENLLKNHLDPFAILLRERDSSSLLQVFYIPEGYPKNPYIRFLEIDENFLFDI